MNDHRIFFGYLRDRLALSMRRSRQAMIPTKRRVRSVIHVIHRHVRAVARAAAAMVPLLPLVAGAQKTRPETPTNVRAAAQGASSAISWTPVAARGATYSVFRTSDASKPGAELARGLTGVAYVDAMVEPGATYFYQVAAVYADGTTRLSAAVSLTVPRGVKVPTPAPGAAGKGEMRLATLGPGQFAARGVAGPAPANLAATPAPTSVALTWSAVPSVAAYAVERNIVAAGQWTLLATASGPAYTDAAMDPDTPVQYRITATYADGRTGTSTPLATRTTKPANPPNLRAALAPHIITAQILPNFQALSLAYADVTLTWDPVVGANSYEVSGSGLTNTRSTTAPAFGIAMVPPGNASWQVVAYFTNGQRRFGDAVNPSKLSVMIGSPPVEGFNGVTYAGPSPAQVDFRWTSNNGATSFKLLRAESEGGPYVEVAPAEFRTLLDPRLQPGIAALPDVLLQVAERLSLGTGRVGRPPAD